MVEFLIFVAVVATAYFAWRIVDQLPDLAYRLSEIQRDVADLRRQLGSAPTPVIGADARRPGVWGPPAPVTGTDPAEADALNDEDDMPF